MDINNSEYFKNLSGQHTELPQEFSNAVQVKNSTAMLVSITEDVQLMPYSYGLISPNNTRFENLVAKKKIKIISFATSTVATIDSETQEVFSKKKRQPKPIKSTSSLHLDAAVVELASIVAVSLDHDKEESHETESNLLDDGDKGAPEGNDE